MKETLLFISLLTPFFPISSCDRDRIEECDVRYNNYGYAGEVSFAKDGDTIVLEGENAFEELSIQEIYYSETICANFGNAIHGDTMIVWHDWLTAETVKGSSSLTLIAAPSSSRVERCLKVTGLFSGDLEEQAIIFVTQKK